jgi:phosphatidate phosphatase APP1
MKKIKPVLKFVRKPLKPLKVYLKQKAGWLGIPKIIPYRGYANQKDIYIQGSVIEDKGLSKPNEKNSIWQNILAMIKRFSGDEIPHVKVKAKFFDMEQIEVTDEGGFFSFHFKFGEIPEQQIKSGWYPVSFELLDHIVEEQPLIKATGEIRIVSPAEKRIIVSDIDDTVLISHSTQTIRKLRLMLLKNALSRLPFKGVSFFYHALERGTDSKSSHPFFYVSSSEWNLYDLLEDFFEHHRMPKGSYMLRRLESSIYKFWKSGQGSHEHKYHKIKFLLNTFDQQNFILIGDSGQKDPQIYKRLALEFPGRVEAIYIRKIGTKIHFENIELLNSNLEKVKTMYLQVEDTMDAAMHAAENGFISKDFLSP